jgi:hypothetical protein
LTVLLAFVRLASSLNRLLSSIEYGALLCYQPRGNSKLAITSRQVRDGVKHDRFWVGGSHRVIDGAVIRLQEHLGDPAFRNVFGPEVVLVPAPRSSPLVKGGLWPGDRICAALVEHGLGSRARPLLVRTKAVNKAATSRSGERPGIHEHLESLRVEMNRTEGLDASRWCGRSGWGWQAKILHLKELAQHMVCLARVLEEGPDTGAKKYRYVRTGTNHFSMAFTYACLAETRARVPVVL